ncbi:SDR family NAD(P)-dependent oxidoreductase, partial [Actinocrinis sp.]|uniref:SDR family NAD(P)-dependent oxidoreductase n=1 Tax=Actinocrinis sp. TaxID=1920516 RepID=UPI002D25153A
MTDESTARDTPAVGGGAGTGAARRLDGTTAVVTGASSGIGDATARALAARGASVVAIARRADRLDALVKEIAADGGTALALPVDVTDGDRLREAVDTAAGAFGHDRIDILVNNAGIMLLGPAATASLEDWRRMVDLNLTALLTATHAALPHLLRAADSGPRQVADLVNVSSIAGRVARLG